MYQVGAHWHHLANTNELSMYDGDAACCQIFWPVVTIIIIIVNINIVMVLQHTLSYYFTVLLFCSYSKLVQIPQLRTWEQIL